MKIMRRVMVLCLALSLVFTAYIPAAAAKNVKLNKKSISLNVGKTARLQIKNTNKKVKWSVKSGKKYISLQQKKKKSVVIKAKKAGTAKVLAKVGKKKLICKIKVKKSSGSTAGKSDSKKTEDQKKDEQKKVTGTPGQNVPLPAGATVFTIGTKNLAIGMSGEEVNTVLGTLSDQEIRTGKSPQGFDTIAYNMTNYQEYLLIYLQNNQVVGICGISKTMSFADAAASSNGNNLSGWSNLNDYATDLKVTAAKKKLVKDNEQAYAFYDALGDNTIYCIQVFDPTKVKDKDNDMIYMTENLTYDATINASIATEVLHMLNAFRAYSNQGAFAIHSGLAACAQAYCDQATSSKLQGRGDPALITALEAAGTDPTAWGEACYYDAADAISFANSLIELDDFYKVLLNAKEVDGGKPIWDSAGAGMTSNGKHTYVTVDYVDAT